ncbi:MAG: serine/threonine-protein kinase [Acidimicrobiales bacterium]
MNAPLLGQVFADRYDLVRLIASGGMGDVYEAQDHLLRRQVAVKVYRASALADRGRFDAEIRTLAALNHPGLVQVYDAGEHDGHGFVVLELVDGPTLRSIFEERGPLPAVEVADLGAAVAAALAHVHEAGVVHRDVTPSNILCGSDGRPRLADFGIARLIDTTRVTAVATTIGTAAYMAPEQVQGHDVTPAADVYALGLVLLEAITGRSAFTGVGHEVALARLARDPDVETDVPEAWHPLLREMTARSAEGRPTTAAVADRLMALGATVPTAAGAVVADADGDVDGDADAESDATMATAALMAASAGAVAGVAASHAHTQVVEAVGGGTMVMPAPLPLSADAHGRPSDVAVHRPWLVGVVAAGIALVIVLAALASGSDSGIKAPTSTTPVAVTVPTTVPTTVPPTTAPPARPGKEKGHKGD